MIKVTKNFFWDILKAVLISILATFVFLILFAIIVKFSGASAAVMSYVNVGIRIVAILLGAVLGFSENKQGIVKGFLTGVIYILLAYLIFAAIDGGFQDSALTLLDAIIGAVVGLIAGVIAVNVKKDKQIG